MKAYDYYESPMQQPRRFYPRRVVMRLRFGLPIMFALGFALGVCI